MFTTITSCPCCKNDRFNLLVDFDTLPCSGSYLPNCDSQFQTRQLSFEYCSRCALIRTKVESNSLSDYTHINRTTGHHLPDYVTEILESLTAYGIGPDNLIVEIGCNDGKFLETLSSAGFSNTLGVEPSMHCADICRKKGLTIKNIYFNQNESLKIEKQYGKAKAVICRHTLEHTIDPRETLISIRQLLSKDSLLVLEVPDARGIINDLHIHELWDEHLYYYTIDNLSFLLQNAGFRIIDKTTLHHKGSMNILYWVSPVHKIGNRVLDISFTETDVNLCDSFKERWIHLSNQFMSLLNKCKKPIAMFGASHPQANFLLYTGAGRYVDFLIDDDSFKIGRYLPCPHPIPILSTTEILDRMRHGTVIRGAFGYENWMDRVCKHLYLKGIKSVDPYLNTCSLS